MNYTFTMFDSKKQQKVTCSLVKEYPEMPGPYDVGNTFALDKVPYPVKIATPDGRSVVFPKDSVKYTEMNDKIHEFVKNAIRKEKLMCL